MNEQLLEKTVGNCEEELYRFSGHAAIYEKILKRFPDFKAKYSKITDAIKKS